MSAPKHYKHVMVDIETMGTAPKGAILAIGAVPFSLHPQRFELAPERLWYDKRCTLEANRLAERLIDPETVEWWMRQSDAAREALLREPRITDFATFIYDFEHWLRNTEDLKAEYIWAKPPDFDIHILRHAFERMGAGWPFHWRATRDVRTILDLAKFNRREDVLGLAFEGEKHNAAHDAAHQARQVVLAYRDA